MKRKTQSRLPYWLLGLYIVASLSYYGMNMAGLYLGFSGKIWQTQLPFHMNHDLGTIVSVEPEAAKAGLANGQTIEELDGSPYSGEAQVWALERNAQPGDVLRVVARKADGEQVTAAVTLQPNSRAYRMHGAKQWAGVIAKMVVPPLLCLLLGYWVVAARPRDPNAWLLLILLSFPEVFYGVDSYRTISALRFQILWRQTLQVIGVIALFLFGIYFPERWRLDCKLPWLKWVLIVPLLASLCLILWGVYGEYFHPAWAHWLGVWGRTLERVFNTGAIVLLVLYWVAILDKLRSASTSDARRRLRVLAVGSVVGLGSMFALFVLLPLTGYDPAKHFWIGNLGDFLFLVFPLSLAYVVLVQRALDVHILVRAGTKYAAARATLVVLELSAAAFIIIRFLVPLYQRKESLIVAIPITVLVGAGLVKLFLARDSLSSKLQNSLDRRFFREAYDAETVLSELSEQARQFTQPGPLIETMAGRISDILHVRQVAVLLRSANAYRLQHAIGLPMGDSVLFEDHSTTINNLKRTLRPATVYRENPDAWLLLVPDRERQLLDAMQSELLLPLHGRERLIGVMSLGPKRSEEPYSPSDLRLLESVANQTGLSLEISELVRSLAEETAQRERAQREMEIAREVQERLFPQELPAVEGVALAGACRPALGVGGDYYDVFALDDGILGLAIGDVSGKGISAALLMASLRASLRGATLDGTADLATLMKRVNRLVYEASATNRYATFFFATYDPKTRVLEYVNGGHNPPFLVRRDAVMRLEAGGPVVGLLCNVAYSDERLELEPGDLLVAYTDGISEAMSRNNEEWGEDRMLAACLQARNANPQKILAHVFSAADAFAAGAPQHDDMTLVVMQLEK